MLISNISAQNIQRIDSILNNLENTTDDKDRVHLLIDLSEEYSNNSPAEFEKYIKKALSLSVKIDYKEGEAFSYRLMSQEDQAQDDYKNATQHSLKSLALYKELGDSAYISSTYFSLGRLQAHLGDYDKSIAYFEKVVEISKELGDLEGMSASLNNIGVLYNYQGKHAKSIECQEESLKVYKELGNKIAVSRGLTNLGIAYDDLSNYAKAIEYYEEALVMKIELNDSVGISAIFNNMGEVHKDKGNYVEAIEYYEKSLNIDKSLNDKAGIAICLLNIGKIHFFQKNYDKAGEYYEESLSLAEEIDNKRIIVNDLNNIGEVLIADGKYLLAIVNLEKSIELCNHMGDESEKARAILYLGDVFVELERYSEAIKQYEKAFDIHVKLGEEGKVATVNIKIGEALCKTGNYNKAIQFSIKGLQIAQKVGSKDNISKASRVLSKSYAKSLNFKKAYNYSVLYKETHDSIYTIESQKQISTIEHSFELERKQSEIELQDIRLEKQEAEITQQQVKQKALLGGFFAVLIIVILAVLGNIRIRKAKDIITEQKEEIQVSNESLNNTNEELRVTLEMLSHQKEVIEKTNKKITDSIHYAKYIQTAILPQKEKIGKIFNDYFVMYKPKDIVSGDFYWTTQIDGKTIIAAADCTGHGVPGAFMSILGITFLNDIVNKDSVTKTDIVLNYLRSEIINALKQNNSIGEQLDGMDVGLCSIDFSKMNLQFSGANTPLYIVRSKEEESISDASMTEFNDSILYEIKGDKMPISMYRKMVDFNMVEINLKKGDCLYMFSDGFIDQFGGPDTKRFQSKNFKQMLLSNCKKPMSEQKIEIEKVFSSWKHNNEQIDDIMVVGFVV